MISLCKGITISYVQVSQYLHVKVSLVAETAGNFSDCLVRNDRILNFKLSGKTKYNALQRLTKSNNYE